MNATKAIEAGVTSVIVPCFANVEWTRRCVSALFRHTHRPWHLIAVVRRKANATDAYLRGVRDAAPFRVNIVVEADWQHISQAWHRGLREIRGDSIALIGPRVIVTDAWLEQLLALANADPWLGMVAPMSNRALGPQRVVYAPSARGDLEVGGFASQWRADHLGHWMTPQVLSGQCLLLKRGVLEAIGLRQEIEPANLRPDRLSESIRQSGFQLGIAHDLYVHQQTDKPVLSSEISNQRFEFVAMKPVARRCRVSLTMIVKNEEANLPACLESARDLFDEIVVVDTGSSDRTVEIARSFGARVFDFPWVDDFSSARNAALARATGDYAFWLDADDRIEPDQYPVIKALLDGIQQPEAAYVVRCSCDPDPSGGGATVVDHVRLFPLREDVRWTYRVHEQILPALRKVNVEVRWTSAVVRHVGYNDPALRKQKLKRDQAILELELADRADDPFVLFNLGAIALETNEHRAALGYLQRSLSGSAATDSITRKLYALISRCHQQLGEPEAGLAACDAGLHIDPADAELWFRSAVLHRQGGNTKRAEECWLKVLTLHRPEQFSSIDVGIYGHLTRRNLATIAEERGDRAEALLQWSAVVAECPGDAEALKALSRLAPTRVDEQGTGL
jgi:GT2 family glycosyltransferase